MRLIPVLDISSLALASALATHDTDLKLIADKSGILGVAQIQRQESAQVNTMTAETKTLQPPAGEVYQIVGVLISILAVPGAGSGNHQIELYINSNIVPILGKSTYNIALDFDRGYWMTADLEKRPIVESSGQGSHMSLWATNANLLTYKYSNITNAHQTNARWFWFDVVRHKV